MTEKSQFASNDGDQPSLGKGELGTLDASEKRVFLQKRSEVAANVARGIVGGIAITAILGLFVVEVSLIASSIETAVCLGVIGILVASGLACFLAHEGQWRMSLSIDKSGIEITRSRKNFIRGVSTQVMLAVSWAQIQSLAFLSSKELRIGYKDNSGKTHEYLLRLSQFESEREVLYGIAEHSPVEIVTVV